MSENMMSVSSLNIKIKSLLEATFMHSLVEGEVASVTYHTSGHLYFSIKDDKSSIKCVMWRSSVSKMKFRIEKGMKVLVDGSVSVYTPRGEYQFQAVKIEPSGQGALALAFEQLKKKLKTQGYFSQEHKKALPKIPRHIVLVTAKDSAALHDMLKIAQNRWALLEVTVVDTLVQGTQAAQSIARALRYADSLGADVVVVGRGGGSNEDLWAFNEEPVADALFAMTTPVVSAVGHEVDTLISDFVADVRAPTPSAAIEMILPDTAEVLQTFVYDEERFRQGIRSKILDAKQQLRHQEEMLVRVSPLQRLKLLKEAFVQEQKRLKQLIMYKLEQQALELPKLQKVLRQQWNLVQYKKEQQIHSLDEKLKLYNPNLQSKESWVQLTQAGKKIALETLKKDDTVMLSNATMRVETKVISLKKF